MPNNKNVEKWRKAEVKTRRDRMGMWAQGETYESLAVFPRRMRLSGDLGMKGMRTATRRRDEDRTLLDSRLV